MRMGVLFRVEAWRTARKWVVLRGWMARETLVGVVPPVDSMSEIGASASEVELEVEFVEEL